jgi:hypothetical protein
MVLVMIVETNTEVLFPVCTNARKHEKCLMLRRYLNTSLNSTLRKDLWNVMSALAKCQYPFYFRMRGHLKEISSLLPHFAEFNVSHFMLQVLYSFFLLAQS